MWYYNTYTEQFLPGTEATGRRVQTLLPRIQRFLPLPKKSNVLDLCCGAGVFSFALEKEGYTLTGLDIQRRMIRLGKIFAKKTGSKVKFVLGDAMNLKFGDDTFDVVIFLGAALAHFSVDDFALISREAFRVLKLGGLMISEASDHINWLFQGTYRSVLHEPNVKGDDVVSFHSRYDPSKGPFERLFVDFAHSSRRHKGEFYIWAPWIFRHVMRDAGFKLKATDSQAGQTVIDVHEKPK